MKYAKANSVSKVDSGSAERSQSLTQSLIFRFFIVIDDLGPHSDVTLLGSYGVCGCPWWRRFSCLAFTWKPGSGRPTHGAGWLGRRQQEWRWSSGCFPKIRYQPESTRCPFDRPEVRQSHPEKESNEQQTRPTGTWKRPTLERDKACVKKIWNGFQVGGRVLTMQEVAPAPPARIMTSEMLLPQCFLHSALDSRGRAACCRLLGVLGAVGQ